MIRAQVSWWPGNVETKGGTHIHHMVWGILLLLGTGFAALSFAPDPPVRESRRALRRRRRPDPRRVRAAAEPRGRLLEAEGTASRSTRCSSRRYSAGSCCWASACGSTSATSWRGVAAAAGVVGARGRGREPAQGQARDCDDLAGRRAGRTDQSRCCGSPGPARRGRVCTEASSGARVRALPRAVAAGAARPPRARAPPTGRGRPAGDGRVAGEAAAKPELGGVPEAPRVLDGLDALAGARVASAPGRRSRSHAVLAALADDERPRCRREPLTSNPMPRKVTSRPGVMLNGGDPATTIAAKVYMIGSGDPGPRRHGSRLPAKPPGRRRRHVARGHQEPLRSSRRRPRDPDLRVRAAPRRTCCAARPRRDRARGRREDLGPGARPARQRQGQARVSECHEELASLSHGAG